MSGIKKSGVLLLFILLILSIYANSFHSSWHLDDWHNIIRNFRLHISDLRPETLAATLYSNPTNPYEPAQKMFRPLPCLTFAINWYFGQDDPFGFHIVNVSFHILTAFFLFLLIQTLYTTPRMRQASSRQKWFVPMLAALLWAVNPIQIQAVTYIVQRMTILAGLFYLLGLYTYLKARLAEKTGNRIIYYGACILCYIMALGSKENAIVLPIAVFLMEFAFFRNLYQKKAGYALMGGIAIMGLFLVIFGIVLFLRGDVSGVIKGYHFRPFSLTERLLTEMRIIVYYITQIFYPVPARLSIEHDVVVSTSLIHPWTTLPAAVFLLSLNIAAMVLLRYHPMIGFSVLFFFINHVIESSIIPLELIFEHRNYLPSFFMFVPPAIGLKWLFDRYGHQSYLVKSAIGSFVVLLVAGYGVGTCIRNKAWATEKSLWEDAAVKAPESARPLTSLAWDMAYGKNADPKNYDEALSLFSKALNLYQVRKGMNASVLNHMAGLYERKREFELAIRHLKESIRQNSSYLKSRYDLAFVYITLGRWEDAASEMEYLVNHPNAHEGYLNQKGLILLHQEKAAEALPLLKRSLSIAPNFWRTLTYLGVASKELGYHEDAERFLQQAVSLAKDNVLPFFCLIDNAIAKGDMMTVNSYMERLFMSYPPRLILSFVGRVGRDNHLPPISQKTAYAVFRKFRKN